MLRLAVTETTSIGATMPDRTTILIVEDDEPLAQMLAEHLRQQMDAEVVHTKTASETIRLDLDDPPDLMITDLLLPDGNGLDLIKLIRSTRDYPVIVITGSPTVGRAVEAMRLGVVDLLPKPFDLARLTSVAKSALSDYRRRKAREHRLERLEKLVHKVVDERRSLQERVDLVCRDLVGAYHDLAQRLIQETRSRRSFDS